jgi:hypothetical protein
VTAIEPPNLFDIANAADPVPRGEGQPHGWIQWKGTEACVDLHCSCGAHGHFDGYFMYRVKCAHCGQAYAVAQNVVLAPVTPEQEQAWLAAYPDSTFEELRDDYLPLPIIQDGS